MGNLLPLRYHLRDVISECRTLANSTEGGPDARRIELALNLLCAASDELDDIDMPAALNARHAAAAHT